MTSNQRDLFDALTDEPEYLSANAPDLDLEEEFRAALKYCERQAKKHGLGRERILERINLCLPEDRAITLRQLNGWMAASAEDRPFPAWILPAYIWAVRGIVSPIEILAHAIGLRMMDENEALAAELGETVLNRARLASQERTLKNKLTRS
jgi:hypothetical protein